MHSVNSELRRGELRAAAALPQVVDGDGLGQPELRLKERPNGKWAIFRGSVYLKSCKTRDRKEAETFLKIYELQQEARAEGIVDARYANAIEIADYYLEQIPAAKTGVRRNDTLRLKRLRPHLEGKRLVDLNGKAVAAIEVRMLERYAPGTVQVSWQALRTAIRVWCRDHATPLILPFGAPTRPPGCDRVLTAEERDRILRWARGSESYDPATGTWSQKRIGRLERHRRLMVGRLLELGLVTGTRGGRFEGLAWQANPKTGHIDVESGLLHRCPPGALASARKQAPPVLLPPGLLAEVRRWKAADGRQRYLFRTRKGGPAGAKLGVTFTEALKKLGIDGVTRHTLRHSCITGLIEQGVPASVISAIGGISVQMLRTRYNHSDDTAVQPIGHASMDRLLPRH